MEKTAHAKPDRIGPLDRLLINAVVDTKQGVNGALGEDELHAAVDEFVNLNGRRHQSCYHAGFRDAIFNQPTAELPADNANQRRWYWTGAILGWARTERWQLIVQALDENETVRGLGDGADRASRSAGLQVANALWKTDRTAELPTFVGKELVRRPDVFRLLLDAGTEALRSDGASVARRVFELLMDCVENEATRKVPSALRELAPTVHRRMAHCLRLLGEHRRAEESLQGLLLEADLSADIQAMIHADLGLLKGHFLLLDDVRIPFAHDDRQNIVERLRAGEDDFRAGAEVKNAVYAAHGHYCLGVLALANNDEELRYETAHRHLDHARAHFKSAPADYPSSLVARADLYLGIAKAQILTAAGIEHAGHLLAEGLRGNAQMSTHLIPPTIEALGISKFAIEEVTPLLLEVGNDEALDALAELEPASELGLVAKKLHERAHRPAQNRVAKAKDLRRALYWFLRLDEHHERSSDVLDELEKLAVSGVAVDEFIELLSKPRGYDPTWTDDDAAIAIARCLEARGDYANALGKLRPVFHHHMSANDLDDAEALLEWVRTLGLDKETYVDLENRYAAAVEPSAGTKSTQPISKQVAVLVVGGDESHAKSQEEVIKKVRQADVAVSVDFIAIDWDANWNMPLESVRRKLRKVDAVVLMRFVRTTFGQHVRRLCSTHEVQWRFCYSGGAGARVQAVLRAAKAARDVLPSD